MRFGVFFYRRTSSVAGLTEPGYRADQVDYQKQKPYLTLAVV